MYLLRRLRNETRAGTGATCSATRGDAADGPAAGLQGSACGGSQRGTSSGPGWRHPARQADFRSPTCAVHPAVSATHARQAHPGNSRAARGPSIRHVLALPDRAAPAGSRWTAGVWRAAWIWCATPWWFWRSTSGCRRGATCGRSPTPAARFTRTAAAAPASSIRRPRKAR